MTDAQSVSTAYRGSEEKKAPWVAGLTLSDFRNYERLKLELGPEPIVLVGENGSGKTNLLEAVSFLAPGQGLRRAAYGDIARDAGSGGWAVSAEIETPGGPVHVGTGIEPKASRKPSTSGRTVRIDRQSARGSGALADLFEMVWLTPAMDGLFTGAAGDRRRFLDRLVLCVLPQYRAAASAFERAMRQRNRTFENETPPRALLDNLESQMAEAASLVASARLETVRLIDETIATRRSANPNSPFAWAGLKLEGLLEGWRRDGSDEDEIRRRYQDRLNQNRRRDHAAGRTTEGPHRSDLVVSHGPKSQLARLCSTGEQKALLINLVLGHAALVKTRSRGAPILLLDEIAAHLDRDRRAALFQELLALGTQAWLTGTDREAFAALEGRARFFETAAGGVVQPQS